MRHVNSDNRDTTRKLVAKKKPQVNVTLSVYRYVWRNCRLAGSPQGPLGVCFQMHE